MMVVISVMMMIAFAKGGALLVSLMSLSCRSAVATRISFAQEQSKSRRDGRLFAEEEKNLCKFDDCYEIYRYMELRHVDCILCYQEARGHYPSL